MGQGYVYETPNKKLCSVQTDRQKEIQLFEKRVEQSCLLIIQRIYAQSDQKYHLMEPTNQRVERQPILKRCLGTSKKTLLWFVLTVLM